MQKSYTLLWICGLVLAAAVGFFASSVVFCAKNPHPPTAPEISQDKPQNEWRAFKKQQRFNFKHQMDSALGLSKEQIAKLDSNGRACDSLRREMSRQIKLAEQELHTILKADKIDEAALQSTRAKLLLLNETRLDQRIQDVKFFKSVLTAEQQKKFKAQESKFDKMHPKGDMTEHLQDEMHGPRHEQDEHTNMDRPNMERHGMEHPNMEGPQMGHGPHMGNGPKPMGNGPHGDRMGPPSNRDDAHNMPPRE
ncbi:MAG: Spy/CpxP family protein refolding chaperone [Fibrobacter sp.]|nr:Spy/CpxP family protein refolding chaperone [Fibrobacter sp.]